MQFAEATMRKPLPARYCVSSYEFLIVASECGSFLQGGLQLSHATAVSILVYLLAICLSICLHAADLNLLLHDFLAPLRDRRCEQPHKHENHCDPLLRQQGVAAPQHAEQNVEELSGRADQRVDQRPKPPDRPENKQLPHSSTQTEEQDIHPGLQNQGMGCSDA
jgi:hypothetical protein